MALCYKNLLNSHSFGLIPAETKRHSYYFKKLDFFTQIWPLLTKVLSSFILKQEEETKQGKSRVGGTLKLWKPLNACTLHSPKCDRHAKALLMSRAWMVAAAQSGEGQLRGYHRNLMGSMRLPVCKLHCSDMWCDPGDTGSAATEGRHKGNKPPPGSCALFKPPGVAQPYSPSLPP